MHANVREDARRKDRLDDIKRGQAASAKLNSWPVFPDPCAVAGSPVCKPPSLDRALEEIAVLALMSSEAVVEVRQDYVYLRRLENRIQALRDQQIHRLPPGEDLERIARGMGEESPEALARHLSGIRQQVSARFEAIFPTRPSPKDDDRWVREWRNLQADRQGIDSKPVEAVSDPMAVFLRRLDRFVLSQRARRRLDSFMPLLLDRIGRQSLDHKTLDRVFDLVLAISRRSVYLVLLVQHVPALDRMLELFARSDWISARVIRFPALLDELIDPPLDQQIPAESELVRSVERIVAARQDAEAVLEGLNYFKLATGLRIAVAQLQGTLPVEQAQLALSGLAAAILKGLLAIAGKELETRHGRFPSNIVDGRDEEQGHENMAIIAYGALGAVELGYDSDLDIVFLFEAAVKCPTALALYPLSGITRGWPSGY